MNKVLFTGALAWFIAQFIKIFIEFIKSKKINLDLIMAAGGMPSSHSSFTCSIATAIGFQEGFDSAIFALSVAFAFIVMYDAQGVRREAGNQAKIINILVEKIEDTGIVMDEKLKELLGHTHLEVFFGAILGIVVGIVMR